jgi:serine/threonine protein kinase
VSDFIAEATMLSTLHHDKILSFRGVCLDASTREPRYLVVELAELNLRTHLDRLGRPVTLTELQRFGCDALDAVSYLHAYNILHRDLKPEKFLVFTVHGVEVLKLADVGMACFAGDHEAVAKSPAAGIASTPFYAAPDVATAFRAYEPRDDVYSFGILMAEIIVKHVMTSGVDLECVVENRDAIVDTAVRYLRRYVPEFAVLMHSCCAFAVGERPTAEDALDTLRGLNCAVVVRVPCACLVACERKYRERTLCVGGRRRWPHRYSLRLISETW